MSQEVPMDTCHHFGCNIKSVQKCIEATVVRISKSQHKTNKFLAKSIGLSKLLLDTAESILQKSGDPQLANAVVSVGYTIISITQLAFMATELLKDNKSKDKSMLQVAKVLLEVQEKVEKLQETITTIAEVTNQLSSDNDVPLVSLTTAVRLMMDEFVSWNLDETDEIAVAELIKKSKWSIIYFVLLFLLVLFLCPGIYFLVLMTIIIRNIGEEPIWARILAIAVTGLMIGLVFEGRRRVANRLEILKSYQIRKEFLKKRLDLLKATMNPEESHKCMTITETPT